MSNSFSALLCTVFVASLIMCGPNKPEGTGTATTTTTADTAALNAPEPPKANPESAFALAEAFAKGGAVMLTRTFDDGTSVELVVAGFELNQLNNRADLSVSGPKIQNGASEWSIMGSLMDGRIIAGTDATSFHKGGTNWDVCHWVSAQLDDNQPLQIILDDGSVIEGHEIK